MLDKTIIILTIVRVFFECANMIISEFWYSSNARDIYGDVMIIQYFVAIQFIVLFSFSVNNNAIFLIYNIYYYFVFAENSLILILYYIEKMRERRNFVIKIVQIKQKRKCIFITILNFIRKNNDGIITIDYN